MTIIAGFPAKGVVVLGADGEEGTSAFKASVKKIQKIDGPGYCCFLAGAGDSNFIDLAVQEAREALADLNPPNLTDIRTTIEHVVTEIYSERIDKLPTAAATDAEFQLLCAIWAEKEKRAELINVGREFSLIRHRPDVLGMGESLATYLIETLHPDPVGGELHLRQAERLCVYVLAKCKAHVQTCGGPSQIIVLADTGAVKEVPQFVVNEDEIGTDTVMSGVRMLFNWIDIIGWQGNIEKINEITDHVANTLKTSFTTRYKQLIGSITPQAAPPTPPPPIES